MPDRPTIYVTNWSSRKLHGPGRKWTIMAKPRKWELGEGVVLPCVPSADDLDAARAGRITVDEYRARFNAKLRPDWLPPGKLAAAGYTGTAHFV